MQLVARMLIGTSMTLVLTACSGFSTGSSHRDAGGGALQCDGDDVIEVFNPLVQTVDIYVWRGYGAPQYFASAPRGQSTISLAGTSYERRSVGFVARVGSDVASDVKIARRCERRSI